MTTRTKQLQAWAYTEKKLSEAREHRGYTMSDHPEHAEAQHRNTRKFNRIYDRTDCRKP